MAKLEDITTILTEEIADLKKVTKEIKEVVKGIDNSSIRNDIAYLKGILETHNNLQLVMNSNSNKSTKELIEKITQSLAYPKWIIQVGIFLMIFVLSIVAYSFYQISEVNDAEIRAYELGKSEMQNHYINFVKDNPDADKMYKEWISKQK